MYRSRYSFRQGASRHQKLDTVESTIERHLGAPPQPITKLELPYEVRNRHVYVVGKTRHGKSTLLHSIIMQDIANGAGLSVIDPKGDLVESILNHIPESRKNDVVYLNAANPVPIDVMSWETEQERQTLAADLMQTFLQFSTIQAGDRWQSILRYLIHTLLEAKNCTFLDINTFLVDLEARKAILSRVKNPALLKYWNETYEKLPKDSPVPVLTRMATFVLVPPLNIMLGTVKPKLKLEDVIAKRQILLVNLTGAGKESGNLIGTLIVSKVQQAIFRRLKVPFHLFADEFQNFQTSAFDIILSEAGGLGLRLTLANQYVGQLEERIRQSVFGNVSTFFVFNIDDADTRYFKSKMPDAVLHERLAHQPPFRALYAIAGQTPMFKGIPNPPPPTADDLARAQYIRARTLKEYACNPAVAPHTTRDEKPEPQATLPHDALQAPGFGTSRGVLRRPDQRPGPFTKKPPDHEK
jgi:hypothetical protein